ncbi:unnamed protein product [Gadus morhua 'NCC']
MNVTELLWSWSHGVDVGSLVANLSGCLFPQSGRHRAHVPGLMVLTSSSNNPAHPQTAGHIRGGCQPGEHPLRRYCKALSFSETFITSNGMLSRAAGSERGPLRSRGLPSSLLHRMGPRDGFIIAGKMDGSRRTVGPSKLGGGGRLSGVYRGAAPRVSGFLLCLTVMTTPTCKVLRVARFH